MEDIELLCMLQNDPNLGMEKLIHKYAGLICSIIQRTLPESDFPTADIEGCVADVFSEFYCHLHLYDPSISSLKTYLCVIARNLAVDHLRKSRKHAGNVSLYDPERFVPVADTFYLEAHVLDKEEHEELLQAIGSLKEVDRKILMRKFFHYQTSKEIAKELGLSSAVVDTRVHRTLKRLKHMLGGIQDEKKRI